MIEIEKLSLLGPTTYSSFCIKRCLVTSGV